LKKGEDKGVTGKKGGDGALLYLGAQKEREENNLV